jgi:hypothetical protein
MQILGYTVVNTIDYEQKIEQLELEVINLTSALEEKKKEVARLSGAVTNLRNDISSMSSVEDYFCDENLTLLTGLNIDWKIPTNKGKIAKATSFPSKLNVAKTRVIRQAQKNNDLSLLTMNKRDIINLIQKDKLVEANIAIAYLAKSKLTN